MLTKEFFKDFIVTFGAIYLGTYIVGLFIGGNPDNILHMAPKILFYTVIVVAITEVIKLVKRKKAEE